MNKNLIIFTYRIILSLLIFFAIASQVYFSNQNPNFNIFNFFSFFTIISNILTAILFFRLAIRQQTKPSYLLDASRGAVTIYMVGTGIVFAVLLSTMPQTVFLPWIHTVLHKIVPIIVVVDLILAPMKSKLPYKTAFVWLIFPLLYFFYSLIRGIFTKWYPYPFADPAGVGGYPSVILYTIVILLCMFLLGLVIIFINRRGKK